MQLLYPTLQDGTRPSALERHNALLWKGEEWKDGGKGCQMYKSASFSVWLTSAACSPLRLVCSLMMHGRNNGKKIMAVRIVRHAMEIIHLLTDQNPLQVIVDAVINSGPREDATRIGSAGVIRRQSVDVSPLRRVNQAIYLLTTGAREAAFRNIKTIAECLADELINAAKGSSNSYAIKKKDEIERVAKANR